MKRTFPILRLSFLLAILCALVHGSSARPGKSSPSSPQSPNISPAAANAPRMEQVIQSFVERKQFMGAVLVARRDEVLLDKGYGFADVELNVQVSPNTKFRLGSITKQFTAALVLMLQERGKLNVNDPIKKYMPDAPAAWDKVTIFNLLTHTSGIPTFTGFPDYPSLEPFATTPEQLVARFRDKPLDFQPGEQWKYSNSGYVLLGYLIEKISGKSYSRFMDEEIFKPLGMTNSGYDSNSTIILNRASGYTSSSGGLVNAGYINMTVPFSAGGLYSTTEDLLRWEQRLFGGKLLSAASLTEMTTPFKNEYAFGLAVHDVDGHRVIDHEGGIEGFNTVLAYYPENSLIVIVLGNVNGTGPNQIARYLGTLAQGGNVTLPSERREVSIDPKMFDRYVGSYQLEPDFILTITRDGKHFMTQATGQNQVEIFPASEHDFFAKVIDAQITFVSDDKGRTTELILHQHGDHHAPRLP